MLYSGLSIVLYQFGNIDEYLPTWVVLFNQRRLELFRVSAPGRVQVV